MELRKILYLLLFVSTCVTAADNIKSPIVHDPVMAKDGDRFYLFCTGQDIKVFSSADMKVWRDEPDVFSTSPKWAENLVPGYKGHTWAPDIIYHNGKYHLFYSCSTFGKNRSAIGHAVNETLNPADTRYEWVDMGRVVNSVPGRDEWNSIDPNVIVDKQGGAWMAFGSFWDGIKLVRLTDNLDSVAVPEEWYTICQRMSEEKPDSIAGADAVEAPFLFYHDGYYYLFVSFDYCCRGLNSDYKVVVGRSENIRGPYSDRNGKLLTKGGGSVLIEGDKKVYAGVGHCAVYDFDGKTIFIAHGYEIKDNGMSHLVVRDIYWDKNNWPLVK